MLLLSIFVSVVGLLPFISGRQALPEQNMNIYKYFHNNLWSLNTKMLKNMHNISSSKLVQDYKKSIKVIILTEVRFIK